MIEDMTKENEIDRLNRLGQAAAQTAQRQNRVMNESGGYGNMARGEVGLGQPRVIGRIALSLSLFIGTLGLLTALGLPSAMALGLSGIVWLAMELGLYALRHRKLADLKRQVSDSQMTLHELRQQELEIEVARAKASGAFDRFEKD